MGGHGRHRLRSSNLLNRGIYWGSATTKATFATVVAVVSVILMAAFTPTYAAPPPQPTMAQQTLPAAVAAWQAKVAQMALTTAEKANEADSQERTEKGRKASREG